MYVYNYSKIIFRLTYISFILYRITQKQERLLFFVALTLAYGLEKRLEE
jgi:hypothetical protein